MSVSITLNGTEWAAQIHELGIEIKDHKMHRPNVKGDILVIPSRTAVGAYKLQLQFPYLNATQMQTLKALFTAQQAVAITHSMDFPQGNYVPTEFAQSRQASLTGTVYTVMMTFALDVVQTLPVPANKSDLTAGIIVSRLGL